MGIALLLARLVLSAVFAVAGLAKLFDRIGTRQTLVDFGVPERLAPPLAVLLPLAELCVSAALLPLISAWGGAVAALVLLVVFTFTLAISLLRGRTPECHCFGQISSSPVGRWTVARNLALAVAAGLIVFGGRVDPGPSTVAWLADLNVVERAEVVGGLLALALIAAGAWFQLQMLRQQGRLILRIDALEARLAGGEPAPSANLPAALHGVPVGAPAPGFRLNGLDGEVLTLDALLAGGKPTFLIFTNPNCGPCQLLMPDVVRWQREYAGSIVIVLLSEGTPEDNRSKHVAYGLSHILLQEKREVADAYHAYGTPGAVLVRSDGLIGTGLAQGADAIRLLVAQVVRATLRPAPALADALPGSGNGAGKGLAALPILKIGDLAPSLKFRDLNGGTVDLADFRGDQILLLFWNPACGFCQRMLQDLREWEASPPPAAPRLLLISTGIGEDNRVLNLRSPIALERDFEAGYSFGANGTPTALLLDAQGRIASDVAAGAEAVFALARGGAKREARLVGVGGTDRPRGTRLSPP